MYKPAHSFKGYILLSHSKTNICVSITRILKCQTKGRCYQVINKVKRKYL